MTQIEQDLFNEFHRLAHKARVGYKVEYDDSDHTYDIHVKSISMFERFHTKEEHSLYDVLTQAIEHLRKIAYPNHDTVLHVAM